MEIQILLRQGLSIRAIARQLCCSRQTVRKYIRMGNASSICQYAKRQPRSTKLDPYKTYILERVEAAKPHWIPGSVLLQEIKAQGYTGGYSAVTAFLLPIKTRTPEIVNRFETQPGEQMQVDFTVIRQGRYPLLAFVATLGWSRATFVRFFADQTVSSWCNGIEAALDFFGGTPRHLLFDNAKAIILGRDVYGLGQHKWNPALLELAEMYGFSPRVCKPYRAKTKGKVERFNRYLKESFVLPLATTFKQSGLILDVNSANSRIGPWLTEVANARIHGTIGVKPEERLLEEAAVLLPLPVRKSVSALPANHRRAVPKESIQHPLSVYQSLLGAMQ